MKIDTNQSDLLCMHQYRHKKLPASFDNMFLDITNLDELQTRNNDYNFINGPALNNYLETFPLKTVVSNWNYLDIECKATADAAEFMTLLKQKILSSYSSEPQCIGNCYICDT